MSPGQGRTAPSQRLADLGITLPEVVPPLAAYVPVTRTGDLVMTAGQLPLVDGALAVTGKVGDQVTPEQAYEAARAATVNALAAVVSEAGSLDAVRRVVRVCVYVAAHPSFVALPQVANGASDLLGEVFGDDGRHVRSAVGVAVLPLDACVEVELVVEVGGTAGV